MRNLAKILSLFIKIVKIIGNLKLVSDTIEHVLFVLRWCFYEPYSYRQREM